MKASFTIEAAVIVPIILFTFCALISLSFELHERVKEASVNRGAAETDTMEEIRKQDMVLYRIGERDGDLL